MQTSSSLLQNSEMKARLGATNKCSPLAARVSHDGKKLTIGVPPGL